MNRVGELARQPTGTLRVREPWWRSWREARDRLVASPAFQRWAASFPLTRPVASRRARELFDICAGFVYSQVLLACVRLRIFELLADGPLSTATLSQRTGLDEAATERLLRAAVALRLLERRRDGWALGPLGAVMPGNTAICAMVEHHALVYADLADPVALLRGERRTGLGSYWPYSSGSGRAADTAQVQGYTQLMADSQAFVRDDVLDAFPMRAVRCLLDVGGGDGSFAMAAARRWPELNAIVFDLPAVAAIARTQIERAGLEKRITTRGGDFSQDPLPAGVDLVSFVRVLHDHEDHTVEQLLRSARRALVPGGRVIVAEPMVDVPGAEPVGDAYFGFYLLAMGSGRARSAQEIIKLLVDAGFEAVRVRDTRRPLQTGLVEARAPFGVTQG